MDAWNEAEEAAKKSSAGQWVRLKDGESVTGVFLGMPLHHEQVWPDGGTSLKVALNFFDAGLGTLRIFDLSAPTFKTLLENKKKYGAGDGKEISAVKFEIKRVGSGTDTLYNIMYDSAVDGSLGDELGQVGLHDLGDAIKEDGAEKMPF